MVNARPNLNGNTPKDFEDAANQLEEAIDAVEQALRTISGNILHGRNYQHIPDSEKNRDARMADSRTMVRAWQMATNLRYFLDSIREATDA